MKTTENPSQAFEAYDEAKKARQAKLREARDLDTQCDARAQSALDSHTVARALSSAEGRYLLEGVAPGRYLVHALFEAEGIRHEWDVEVTVTPGQQLSFDLTNGNQTRSEPLPIYR
jgi:predicted transcriptional regulator of viral defense system